MEKILIVRLGAMGDIIHALPTLSTLRASFPHSEIFWVVAPRWIPLLAGHPAIKQLIPFDRTRFDGLRQAAGRLWRLRPDCALDLQGLMQSAVVGRLSRPHVFIGFDTTGAREKLACLFYSKRVAAPNRHVIDKNLMLAEAAGAKIIDSEVWLPTGVTHDLPASPFVLASPLAGWPAKQWPFERYEALGELLERSGLRLAVNVPPGRAPEWRASKHVHLHISPLEGLIGATRRAAAVLAMDSGPLHLAAALRKPGVALFGPTDPARNGPAGGTITVLRAGDAQTTYKRTLETHPSMRAHSVEQVAQTLLASLKNVPTEAGRVNG